VSSPEATWLLLLDALERDCDVSGSGAPPSAFVPPPAPGPLPVTLLPRARRLERRMTELIDELERQRAELGRELAALAGGSAAGRPSERPHPHFFDTSA
jgi:hypothetical protein